jgi:hypothetical protein
LQKISDSDRVVDVIGKRRSFLATMIKGKMDVAR